MKNISANLTIASISKAVQIAIGLFIIALLTRLLGPTKYGEYNIVFSYLYVVGALADLGLYTVLTREISKEGGNETEAASKIFSLRLFVVIVLSVIGIAVSVFLPYSKAVKTGIALAGLYTVFSSLGQVITGIFQKYLRLYWVSLADIISRVIQLLLILAILFFKREETMIYFIWAVVVSEAARFLIVFIYSRKLIKIKLSYDPAYYLKTIKIALPVAVSLISVLVYFKLDAVILSFFRPAYDVGVYSVAYKVLETIIFLPAIYTGLVLPILSKYSQNNLPEFRKAFNKSFGVISMMAFPTMIYFSVLAGPVIKIIGGAEFIGSIKVLEILSLAIFLIFFGNLAGNTVIALDLQKKSVWIYIIGAILNLGSNLILIPRYGYFAAAWTTVGTELFITVAIFWLIRKKVGFWPDLNIFFKSLAAGAIMLFAVLGFKHNLILGTALSLSFPIAMVALGGFSLKDILDVIKFRGDESAT